MLSLLHLYLFPSCLPPLTDIGISGAQSLITSSKERNRAQSALDSHSKTQFDVPCGHISKRTCQMRSTESWLDWKYCRTGRSGNDRENLRQKVTCLELQENKEIRQTFTLKAIFCNINAEEVIFIYILGDNMYVKLKYHLLFIKRFYHVSWKSHFWQETLSYNSDFIRQLFGEFPCAVNLLHLVGSSKSDNRKMSLYCNSEWMPWISSYVWQWKFTPRDWAANYIINSTGGFNFRVVILSRTTSSVPFKTATCVYLNKISLMIKLTHNKYVRV